VADHSHMLVFAPPQVGPTRLRTGSRIGKLDGRQTGSQQSCGRPRRVHGAGAAAQRPARLVTPAPERQTDQVESFVMDAYAASWAGQRMRSSCPYLITYSVYY
jgi:hypothetical protein